MPSTAWPWCWTWAHSWSASSSTAVTSPVPVSAIWRMVTVAWYMRRRTARAAISFREVGGVGRDDALFRNREQVRRSLHAPRWPSVRNSAARAWRVQGKVLVSHRGQACQMIW